MPVLYRCHFMTRTTSDRSFKVSTVQAQQFLRRSPLYRCQQQQGAVFVTHSDAAMVASYGQGIKQEVAQARSLAIADLTPLPRTGFKGPDTIDWAIARGLDVPDTPNSALVGNNGLTTLRLSQHEILVLDSVHKPGREIEKLCSGLSMDMPERTYLLQRADSHAWFALTGQLVPEMLSKVCAVDMRLHKFTQCSIAQTSVARSNSIVVRADQGDTLCFYVLADLSACQFMWEVLLDAMAEFQGRPVGWKALQRLAATD